MIAVAAFSFLRHDNDAARHSVSTASRTAGYALTFVLAVYGGSFSGGHVTMLTAVFVFCFGLSFLQSVATTKVINIFSSFVATVILAWRGIVDYRLGALLGAAPGGVAQANLHRRRHRTCGGDDFRNATVIGETRHRTYNPAELSGSRARPAQGGKHPEDIQPLDFKGPSSFGCRPGKYFCER
jgi:sulfite exporter TauE/SafE